MKPVILEIITDYGCRREDWVIRDRQVLVFRRQA
jgi:hypothetical protein